MKNKNFVDVIGWIYLGLGILTIASASIGTSIKYVNFKNSENGKIESEYKQKEDSLRNAYRLQIESLNIEKEKRLEKIVK